MTGFPRQVREIVAERSTGCCEICGEASSDQTLHHRRPRQLGGSKRPDTNTASNALSLCGSCHRITESHRALAYERGHLVHSMHSPISTPCLYRGEWVLLDDEGSTYRVPAPEDFLPAEKARG